MKIVIAGGGTGGHIFPGVAVARELRKTIAGAEVFFVGTSEGLEARIIPREGFDLRFIRSRGLVGKGTFRSMISALQVPLSLMDSYRVLKDLKPDLVFGVGGYCSGPVVLCAFLMGIPTIIHEQNTIPGLTNRLLGRFVKTIAVTYHESMDFFPQGKTYLTGNPVREEILKGDRERGYRVFGLEKGLFTIFIFGGSRGASKINKAMGDALAYLEDFRDEVQFLHQTGDRDFDVVKEIYRAKGFRGTVVPFTYHMADAYAVADIVVSRAGATTLAELTACGRASILIPYPFAAGNHQEGNARKLCDIGAAHMILDKDLDGRTLSEAIKHLLRNPDLMDEMKRTSRALGSPDAASKVIKLMTCLVKGKDRISGHNPLPEAMQGKTHNG